MRTESAASAKGKWSCQQIPREGTRLRAGYFLFQANKGLPIEASLSEIFCSPRDKRASNSIEQLRSFYGMDIRKLGPRRWVLAGEWFGREYRDYIADRIHEVERR